MRPSLRILEPELIDRIVDEAKRVLAEVGMEIRGAEMRAAAARAGLPLRRTPARVLFPRDVVEAAIASRPELVHPVRPRRQSRTPTSAATASTSCRARRGLKVLDHRTGEARLANSTDFAEYVRLGDGLEHIPYLATAFSTNADIEAQVSRRVAALPVPDELEEAGRVGRVHRARRAPDGRDDGSCSGAGRDDLIARPMSIFTITATGNFRYSEDSCQNLIDCVEAGIPVEIVPVTLMGLIAPVTLVGATVFHTVDVLAGITMAQVIRPGAPVLFGGAPATFHMKIASSPMAAIEALQLDVAYVAVAKSPRAADASRTWRCRTRRSSTPRPAPRRSAARCSPRSPASTRVSGPGMLDFLLVFTLPKLVFDDEMCGQALHFVREVRPLDDLPVDALIDQLMADQHLIMADHTTAHWPDELYLPARSSTATTARPGCGPAARTRTSGRPTRSSAGSRATASRDRPARRRRAPADHPLGPGRPDRAAVRAAAARAVRRPSGRPGPAAQRPPPAPPGGTCRMTAPLATPATTESSTLYFGPWYRRSPFFEKTLEAGCSAYDIYNHMYLPGYYGDPVEEYWALLNDVTALGRRGRADRRDHRAGRVGVHEHADLPRPDEVRRRPGQVRPDHGRGRRHRQRPGPAPRRGEPLVARPRRLATPACGRAASRSTPASTSRSASPRSTRSRSRARSRRTSCGRCSATPSPTSSTTGRLDDGARRHPGRHQPDRLDRRGRLRDLPPRPVARRRAVGPDHGGRPAARHPADRAVRGAPDRGRDLQLRLGHDDRRTTRSRSWAWSAWSSRRTPTTSARPRSSAIRARGVSPQARRHRGRGRRAAVRDLARSGRRSTTARRSARSPT